MARCRFADVIRLFVDFGIALDVLDGNGWAAIHAVARTGNVEVIELLAEAGCDLDVKSRDGWTPLHVAVRSVSVYDIAAGAIHCVLTLSFLQYYDILGAQLTYDAQDVRVR